MFSQKSEMLKYREHIHETLLTFDKVIEEFRMSKFKVKVHRARHCIRP